MCNNVIDYNYTVSENGDYDYLRACTWLQSIMIIEYNYPMPVNHLNDWSYIHNHVFWTRWK